MLGGRRRRRASINPALGECIVFAGIATMSLLLHSKHSTFLRRWANIKTTLAQRLVSAGLSPCCVNAGPASTALAQH